MDSKYSSVSRPSVYGAAIGYTYMPMRAFCLRVAVFLHVSATILSLAALLTYVRTENLAGAYTAGLSAIITFVAAYHYHAILKVRTQPTLGKDGAVLSDRDEELEVDGLRHSDWLVTLPLLVLKLYAVIGNSSQDLIFNNPELSALMAILMILFGAIARLALDWGLPYSEMGDWQRWWVFLCYIVSIALLSVLILDLGNATSGSAAPSIMWSFFLVWIGYPIVAIGSFFARSRVDAGSSAWMSFCKDLAYVFLDTWSKAVFAWWTASRCFGINFLGV